MDQRAISFTTAFNFRDLGGHSGAGGRSVHYGRVFRSDSLHRLTEAECAQLTALGVRTVLDLRRPKEIARDGRIRDTAGLAYHNIHPVHREWNPARYDEVAGPARYLADRYLDMTEEGGAGLGEALRLIADPDRGPVVFHCFAGKDRTGVLSALILSLLGVSDEDIAADYALSEAAQPMISAAIRAGEGGLAVDDVPMHFIVCPPLAMRLFLAGLRERYGSVAAYAATTGFDDGHAAALRAHLLS